jgi:asparagine synthase (glutamine-hydrolysing)
MSDVPLGLFLSGGIDSTAIAALMARHVDRPIRSFSVGFDEPGASELAWARAAARAVGAEHREITVEPERFLDVLPRLVHHEDEPIPFPASVPLYFVSRLAAADVKVVLTGEGADELFLGYNRYRVAAWNARLDEWAGALLPPRLREGVAALATHVPGRAGRALGRSFAARPAGARSLLFDAFATFPEAVQRALLADPAALDARDPYAGVMAIHDGAGGDMLDRMSVADVETYLVQLLMKQDRMSMAASIESRVPFLDHELVEYASSIPGRFRLRGLTTKAVLRRAVRDVVPREILERRKMGFPVPVGRWLRGRFAPVLDELVLSRRAQERSLFRPEALERLVAEHRSARVDHGDRLWLLLNLEIWQRVFVDGEEPALVLAGARRTAEPVAAGSATRRPAGRADVMRRALGPRPVR